MEYWLKCQVSRAPRWISSKPKPKYNERHGRSYLGYMLNMETKNCIGTFYFVASDVGGEIRELWLPSSLCIPIYKHIYV